MSAGANPVLMRWARVKGDFVLGGVLVTNAGYWLCEGAGGRGALFAVQECGEPGRGRASFGY